MSFRNMVSQPSREKINLLQSFINTVVVTQLAEWSLPTRDILCSNPSISKISIEHLNLATTFL